MDYSYSQGELGEVVRASRVKQSPLHRDDEPNNNQADSSWSFPSSSDLVMDLHREETTTNYDCFGNNPFAVGTSRDTNDELLHEICMPTTISFFISNNSDRTNSAAAADPMNATTSAAAPEDARGGYFCSEDRQASGGRRVVEEEGIFAGMLRISSSSNNTAKAYKPFDVTTYGGSAVSPSPSPREVVKQAPFLSTDHMIINEGSSVRISSPQGSYAKRRKKEAKKVICIPFPAPPPSNGKSSGEVVPPDLWAWRKYGQKPIKGSPYPRGYYRCSSSKGCPARKQVEKSRNDPNMLVVTYTCEHNHAWPTQRNALAGSTTAQPNAPSKTNAASSSSDPKSSPSTSNSQVEKDLNNQESNKESINVKEEETRIVGIGHPQMNVDGDEFNDEGYRIQVSDQMAMALNRFSEDFFADLGEIEKTSSIDDLLLNAGKSMEEYGNECKAIDPIFSFLDWSSST